VPSKAQWSKNHSHCVECKGTRRRHMAKGLCVNCYNRPKSRLRYRKHYATGKNGNIELREHGLWARNYDSCTECGRTNIKHEARGLCVSCYSTTTGLAAIHRDRRTHGGNRAVAIERDKGCRNCGTAENLHVHHVDQDRSNNDLDNLLTLCAGCHARHHNDLRFKKEPTVSLVV